MAPEHRTYEMEVSEPLFRLATECIHLLSNEARTFETLDGVIAARSKRAADGFPGHEIETISGHLETMATAGATPIVITLGADTDEDLATARAALAVRLERPLSLAETVSVLLFDLTIDRASASMLEQLLGTEAPARGERSPALSTAGEVIPIR